MPKLYSLLVAFILAVTLLMPQPANARGVSPEGCRRKHQHASIRMNTFNGATVDFHAAFTHAKFRVTGQTLYFNCHDTVGPEKIEPTNFRFCVKKLDNHDLTLMGVFVRGWWNAPLFTGVFTKTRVDPDERVIRWRGNGDKGDKRCTLWEPLQRKWFRMVDLPFWTADGHADQPSHPDKQWTLTRGGSRFRAFSPHHDVVVVP